MTLLSSQLYIFSCLICGSIAWLGDKKAHWPAARSYAVLKPPADQSTPVFLDAKAQSPIPDSVAQNEPVPPNANMAIRCSRSLGSVSSQLLYDQLYRTANHSWEWGTQAQYVLEGFYPSLGVFSPTRNIPLDTNSNLPYPKELFDIIDPILLRRSPGIGPIIVDDAAGDPVSLLIGVMVMGATVKTSPYGWNQSYYNQVAQDQLDFLFRKVQRTDEGAISHRVKELQLWNDFVFMAPPSIVYYGAAKSDLLMIRFGYHQAKAYRQTMQDPVTKTWYHILKGSWQDETLWSTGNAWVAYGLMRMWATMEHISDEIIRVKTKSWQADLIEWVIEIVVGAFQFQIPTSKLLPNRYGSNSTFEDTAGTALLAAAAYRLVTYIPEMYDRLPMEKINCARIAILSNNVSPLTGVVSPVVDPLNWSRQSQPGVVSPEAQAFVLFMKLASETFMSLHQRFYFPVSTANLFD